MPRIDTVIIGAGQAGLALSRCLTDRGREHLVLERGRTAERWHSERWGSLRLLTPNWMSRLPGWAYRGPDPNGFMTAPEVADYFVRYAHSFDAPVSETTTVEALERRDTEFVVRTDRSTWRAANVVIATGWCDEPAVPALAATVDSRIHQTTPSAYRNPATLPDGGVLVVGAAASGVQLADELRRAGREVVLAAGSHTRLPRRYRGMDIWWWLEQIGSLDRTIDELTDHGRARREPSLQLVGRPDGRGVDLATLQALGVRLTGRLTGASGSTARFASDLPRTTAKAEARLRRVLADIDEFIAANGLTDEVFAPEPIRSVDASRAPERLDLRAAGITTVLWATGFRRPYPWLRVPVLDATGELRHRRGVTPVPGLYVLGQRFQHRRNSNFIDGVRHDARYIADRICHHVPLPAPLAAACDKPLAA